MTSNQVHVDKELLEQRLKRLIELYDEVHDAATSVDDVAGRQTSEYWSTNPSATQFAGAYATALNGLSTTLLQVRDRIEAMRDALADSAKTLATTDEQIGDLFAQLATRFAPPPLPLPTVTAPMSTTTPTSFPTGTPTPTTAPSPTAPSSATPAATPVPTPLPSPSPTTLDALQ